MDNRSKVPYRIGVCKWDYRIKSKGGKRIGHELLRDVRRGGTRVGPPQR